MRRLMTTACVIVVSLMLFATVASAWTPPGQRGYEGQPGNQGAQHSN